MKSDQKRVTKLLTDTVTLLCKNGLVYSRDIQIQGLLGITVDKSEVFLVHIDELIGSSIGVPSFVLDPLSEPSPRKRKTVAGSLNEVDLTEVADNPRPFQQSPSRQMPPGQIAGRQKHRPPMPPAMMVPQQQRPPRMQRGPRPRMSGSPLHGTVSSGQFASNYLTQLQQQVARGASPSHTMPSLGMPPTHVMPSRQRPVKRRLHEPMPPQTATTADDDDEDVLIVGTGYEEPSPSWRSPMRKRPLPSRIPNPPPVHPPQTSSHRPAVRESEPIIEQLSSSDEAGTLELTTDVPTSTEAMIMEIAPIVMTTPQKHGYDDSMLPEVCAAGMTVADSTLSLQTADEEYAAMMQPDTSDSAFADDINRSATISQENLAEKTGEGPMDADATESLQPFVYTDIACDMVRKVCKMQLTYAINCYF